MVRHVETAHARAQRQRDNAFQTPVSPAPAFFGLLGRVLRISNEDGGIFYKIHNPRLVLAVCFMIGEEHKTSARCVEAIAKTAAGMVRGTCGDAHIPELQLGFSVRIKLLEAHFALHGFEGHGEAVVAIHLFLKNRLQRIGPGIAPEDAKAIVFDVGRNEKGKPLDVVPVGVGIKKGEGQGGCSELIDEGTPERADAGAGVDDNDLVLDSQFQTGRVAAIAGRRVAWCGNRAPDTPETRPRLGMGVSLFIDWHLAV